MLPALSVTVEIFTESPTSGVVWQKKYAIN